MKKKNCILFVGLFLILTACGNEIGQQEKNTVCETEEQNDVVECDTEHSLDEDKHQLKVPSKEEVIRKREYCLKGMTEEDITVLKENIKSANQVLENAYFYDNIFEKLSDSKDLYWNYIDQQGEIVIGYAFEEGEEYKISSGLSFEEYAMEFGVPVKAYNKYDAESFVKKMEELKNTVCNQELKKDFDNLTEYMNQAKNTHDVKYIEEIYYILHDMDYYLLRYAPDDIGPYVQDTSTINKYYGVLEVYKRNENKRKS